MRTIIALLIGLLSPVFLHSQDHYRVLEVEYEYAPNNRQEEILENEVDIQEWEANVSLPIPRENGDAFVFGFGYNDLKLFPDIEVYDPVPDTIMVNDYDYGRFRVQGGYSKKIDDNTSIVFMGFFRVASDFVNITSDHYLYGGLGMVTKKKSDRFTLKYGLYANTEHYGWLIIPLIGGSWKASDKLTIYGVLPRRLTASWKWSDRFRSGFIFEAPNRTYRHSENTTVVLSENKSIDTYNQNIKNIVYVFGEVYLTKSIVLRARVGYSVFREIELYEYQSENSFITWGIEYGAERTPIRDVQAFRDLEDGAVLNASIEYRFSLD